MYGAPGNYSLPTGMPDTAPGTGITPRALGRPTAGGLGLGLGLNPLNRGRFMEAAQQGNAQQFLATRPWLQQRINNRITAGSPQETGLQNFMATGVAPTGVTPRNVPNPDLMAARQNLRQAQGTMQQDITGARQAGRAGVQAARQNLRGVRRGLR